MHPVYNLAVLTYEMKEICSGKCPIHPNSDECVKFRLNQLKIAVAVAIVRNRPKDVNQSATEFVINLQLSLQNKVSFFHNESTVRIFQLIVY